jgi:hypothetical protein
METQQVRLRKIPKPLVRLAKSRAVLEGKTLEDYLVELIAKGLRKTYWIPQLNEKRK